MHINLDIDDKPDINVNPNVDSEVKQKVVELSDEKYLSACRPAVPKIDMEMNIVLKHKQPFSYRSRRLSFVEKQKLQEILDELLERGIIRESCSPYCSPIVLVRKKNTDKLRLCVDYRELNKITIRDHYPIPLIDDHLDSLRSKSYFSCLDLKSGFHHVQVAPSSVKYTSFITPLGQFEYTRMPFGLCNAPSVFQRYINEIFRDLVREKKVLIYLDDILIATDGVSEHLEILEKVFTCTVENLLELRIDKCSFLKQQIVYLGYLIDMHGIRPDPANVESVVNYPVPRDAKGCS